MKYSALRAPLAWLLALPLSAAMPQEEKSVDDLLGTLQQEYGNKSKRYDSLAKSIKKEIDKALEETVWVDATGTQVPLAQHPYFAFVEDLVNGARDLSKKKNSSHVKKLLERFPWDEDLELAQIRDLGADREIPAHTNGFVHLGQARVTPGFPDLVPNLYLYGLRQIVGWQYGVKTKRKVTFEGRTAKNGTEAADELPGWESLRVYLEGSLPEIPLYAIPVLTHRIHARLAERRAPEKGEASRMDECLAFFDSKWNGFTFEPVASKDSVVFVQPAHFLLTDTRGFVQSFQIGGKLAGTGDVPFFSVFTNMQFAKHFLDKELTISDVARESAEALAADREFRATTDYLARYKTLIDLFVRAALSPTLRYPSYMENFDYPEGRVPARRALDSTLDITRKHALVVWAAAGGSPEAVADFLFDELLGVDAYQFPADVALPVQLTLLVREKEAELLAQIALRVEQDTGGAFAREFSPNEVHLATDANPASEYLAHSHATYHAPISNVIREIAQAIVRDAVK